MFLSWQALDACQSWVKRSLKKTLHQSNFFKIRNPALDCIPGWCYRDSTDDRCIRCIGLSVTDMAEMTDELIVKEFLSPLIAMRRPEWMCPPMGPPKHLTCATVARFRTKLFTSRKKDHHIKTPQNSELWFDQKQKILFLSPFVPKKISHRQLEWSCLEYHTLVAKQTDWKGQVLPHYVQLFLKNPSLQFSIT